MADAPLQSGFEDTGTTTQYAGSVGVTAINIPTAAGDPIVTCLVRCPAQTPNTRRLLYSFDGGVTFHTLSPGEYIGWSLRGAKTQIQIKGNVASVVYEVTLNREST